MSGEQTTNLIRPGRIPDLILSEPRITTAAVDRRAIWTAWVEGGEVFPRAVTVDEPPTPHRRTELGRGGVFEAATFYTHGITFAGWGSVVVTGLYGRKCEPTAVSSYTAIDAGALLDAASLDSGYPDGLCWMPFQTVSKFTVRRLCGTLAGLAALAYRLRPDWWGGESPVVQAWCDSWEWSSQLPRKWNERGLDLTQLDTY